jgi:hypothetical protein
LSLLIVTVVCVSAQEPDSFVGTWTGSWDGAGTGGFELTLEKGKEGALTGRVSVTGEPTYKATLRTVSIDGAKMTATYDFPPDESLEVLLVATFEGNKAKGTWTARGKNGGSELVSGTWTVTKS